MDDSAEGAPVSGEEPVTSPDQHKPMVSPRLAWLGAIGGALAILSMLIGNHEGRVEDIFLIVTAAILLLIPIVNVVLRRNGLKSD
jgi:hypothetical protein